jgi:hypothetical protein
MGFNKRIVDEEILIKYFEKNKPLKVLFNADALILDDKISSMAYDLYTEGKSDEEIKLTIKNIQNEVSKSN